MYRSWSANGLMDVNSALLHAGARQSLIFDADDTLWENNIHFLAAIDAFLAWLDHADLSHAAIREILDEIELANRGAHGYGARAFARNLRQTFRRISPLGEHDPREAEAEQFGLRILEQSLQLLDGVAETLATLATRHELFLLTKGDEEEQRLKIARSGLERFFTATVIAHEKSTATYQEIVATHRLDTNSTWMIGNSPRSDINPALAAGLNAIYIPHRSSWHLEMEEITAPARTSQTLLELASIRELTPIFAGSMTDVD